MIVVCEHAEKRSDIQNGPSMRSRPLLVYSQKLSCCQKKRKKKGIKWKVFRYNYPGLPVADWSIRISHSALRDLVRPGVEVFRSHPLARLQRSSLSTLVDPFGATLSQAARSNVTDAPAPPASVLNYFIAPKIRARNRAPQPNHELCWSSSISLGFLKPVNSPFSDQTKQNWRFNRITPQFVPRK
jgi:hypothetical protein